MQAPANRPIKILAVYENGAGGHRASALAIAEAVRQHPGTEASTLDIGSLALKARKRLYSKSIDVRYQMRPIVRFAFSFGLRPNPILTLNRAIESIVEPFVLRRFVDYFHEHKPDLLITTHFRVNIALNGFAERGHINVPIYSVIPDFMAHGLYPQKHIDGYFVASDMAKADLVSHGVDPARVQVTGLPVSLTMGSVLSQTPEELRRKLGLRVDLPVFLATGGARGDQDYETVLRTVEALRAPIQVVVLCGWNTALKERLERYCQSLKTPVTVKDFQSNMAEWYRAADLVLTKGGSMIPAEAMSMGKALLVCGTHPGKEEIQTARLTNAGVFRYVETPQQAAEVAVAVLADPQERLRLEAAARAFQPVDSAARIARFLVQSLRPTSGSDAAMTAVA